LTLSDVDPTQNLIDWSLDYLKVSTIP